MTLSDATAPAEVNSTPTKDERGSVNRCFSRSRSWPRSAVVQPLSADISDQTVAKESLPKCCSPCCGNRRRDCSPICYFYEFPFCTTILLQMDKHYIFKNVVQTSCHRTHTHTPFCILQRSTYKSLSRPVHFSAFQKRLQVVYLALSRIDSFQQMQKLAPR